MDKMWERLRRRLKAGFNFVVSSAYDYFTVNSGILGRDLELCQAGKQHRGKPLA